MQADFSARVSSSFAWDFGFQGEFLDDETGYINYGYRFYVPLLGRWLSCDPIGERGGLNLYAFVGNNGINRRDFHGLRSSGTCEVDPKVLSQCDSMGWNILKIDFTFGGKADYAAEVEGFKVTWQISLKFGCRCKKDGKLGPVCGETECGEKTKKIALDFDVPLLVKGTSAPLSVPTSVPGAAATAIVKATKLALGGSIPSSDLMDYVFSTRPDSNDAGVWTGSPPSDCKEF